MIFLSFGKDSRTGVRQIKESTPCKNRELIVGLTGIIDVRKSSNKTSAKKTVQHSPSKER